MIFPKVQEEFFAFLRFQSISTNPAYRSETELCANWLKDYLEECHFSVETWPASDAPILLASHLSAGKGKKTLLFYCHYDVQPPEPLSLWHSPPFEPTLRDEKIYARGASDDKGQCFYTLTALKHYYQKHGNYPLNIKFLIEGGEECGSVGLSEQIEKRALELQADYLLIVDMSMQTLTEPQVTLGTRGLMAMELRIKEAHFDLHSGSFGGLAYNPCRAIAEILAKTHDAQRRVAIPGFYDDVVEPSPGELAGLDTSFDMQKFRKDFGFTPTAMEEGISPRESVWLRPTLEINGFAGGYTGEGVKTVIAAEAFAKITCRLVPKQKPAKIYKLLERFIQENCPKGVQASFHMIGGGGESFRCTPSALSDIVQKSYSDVLGKPCKRVLAGGSIPIAPMLAKVSGAEALLIGTALESDLIHSPNEHLAIASFEKGYETIMRILDLIAPIS